MEDAAELVVASFSSVRPWIPGEAFWQRTGAMHTVGLKSDDTVVAAGDIHLGQWDGENRDLN